LALERFDVSDELLNRLSHSAFDLTDTARPSCLDVDPKRKSRTMCRTTPSVAH
jgi:hypothetical protein